MFYVFGVQGRTYQGGIEQLQHIVPVTRVTRARALHSSEIDVPDAMDASTGAASVAAPATSVIGQEARNAYGQAAQPTLARSRLTRVADLMSYDVVTLAHDATAAEAWKVLAARHISQAPVVDAQGRLIGLLMRADMLPTELLPAPEESASPATAAEPPNAPLWQGLALQPVSALMLTPVPSVERDTDVRRAAQVMLERDLPGLAVTDDSGRIVGFLSRTDILHAVVADPPLDLWS